MTGASAKSTTTPAGCGKSGHACYQVAAVVSDLLERLLRETARDGLVRVEDAIRILKLVGRGTYELDLAFEAQEKACRQALAPRRDTASSRANPFRRLMVRPFETLLGGEPAFLPRPLLVNYFTVVETALADKYAEYDRHSRSLLQALLVNHGHNLNWEVFYAEPRVGQILAHALKRLMRFLETPPGQWVWVQTMSRQAPSGLMPTVEQSDAVREALVHTLRGFELMAPPPSGKTATA